VLGSSHIKTSHLSVASPDYASIAFGDGSVWVLTYPVRGNAPSPCGKLVRVSAATAVVTGAVPIPRCPDGVAYGQGSVWVLSFAINVRGYQLVRVNPATLAIESVTRIDAGRTGVTLGGDTGAKYLFVTATPGRVFAAVQDARGRSQIVAVDPATGSVATSLTLGPAEAVSALGVNHAAVWVATDSGRVLGLDPATGAVKFARRVGVRVISLSASGRGVWVTVNLSAPPGSSVPGLDVLRLDPATGAIGADTGLPMIFVATDGASVWALSSAPPFPSDAGLVAQVNPATGVIVKRAELPTVLGSQPPYTIGVYRGSAWVINYFRRTLTKISP
jgi:outer membrane protein assembly factor BamB